MRRIEIPVEVEELLFEFKEVILEGFPKGFIPIIIIYHQIYFIPGSNLPNKSPHRMTLTKNQELNR